METRDYTSLQSTDNHAPEYNPSVWQRLIQWLHKQKAYDPKRLTDPEPRAAIEETRRILAQPLKDISIKQEIPAELTAALEENIFWFSGFKTHHELVEASRMLKGEDGNFKPFQQFSKDVETLNKTYNKNYLRAEYNFATASSQMAVKWKEWEKDGDRYDLQYRTAGDDRVREEHAALDGTTLPPSDPFWDHYLPPNGWNCRCTAVQVRKGKYPQSNSEEAIARGQACTAKPKQQIFRFNPGKQEKIFPPKHPYYKAPGEVVKAMETIDRHKDEHRKEYERLKKNSDYTNVEYDEPTGGVKATHREHNFDKDKGIYEKKTRDIGYKNGYSVILESEKGKGIGENYTEGCWNGYKFELASCEKTTNNNNILKGLKHCASKSETETAVLYFPNGGYIESDVTRAIRRYYGLKTTLGDGFKDFVEIYVVCGNEVYKLK